MHFSGEYYTNGDAADAAAISSWIGIWTAGLCGVYNAVTVWILN
jgi:hypothetical protein